ncbi:hypothetical protein [Microbacterium sp.]|uniref:hypothetical protein n=1 Tax=Microbacterium sp. TaxID=51671 RepID=UPI003A92CB59
MTVAATALTSLTPTSSAPPRTAHSGTIYTSALKPAKLSADSTIALGFRGF